MTWQQGKPRTGQAWWKGTRLRILNRDDHRCTWITNGQRCNQPATDVDHITSEANGGTHEDHNLTSLCPPHHRAKTAAEGVQARQRQPRNRTPEPHPGLRH